MYSIEDWDGLAKIGIYETSRGKITTPALFPVVDPRQQDIPIQDFRDRFGFEQVITSAYLMSKHIGNMNWDEYPDVHDYLEYDGSVMMDSGAYQVMLYGDIDLDVKDTIDLQKQVKPNIGVLMDHPIGYDVSFTEAKRRVETTIKNVKASIPHFKDSEISWTLPIQGGKFLSLLDKYLEEMAKPEILEHFDFYALGSVVPVMINQDYNKLVEMIIKTRNKLPVSRPLHLFGAGHPAMFALATYLGCDTFDSAAYVLMAKDGRYMTVDGTYELPDLSEFPCNCPICVRYTPDQIRAMPKDDQVRLISEHNLFVSAAEIRKIRVSIREGSLWDLVMQRASAVPNLAQATTRAIELLLSGDISQKYFTGIPVSKDAIVRVNHPRDSMKPSILRVKQVAEQYYKQHSPDQLILIYYAMYQSIYNKLPDEQLWSVDFGNSSVNMLLPPFGLIPIGYNELYPIGQLINEVSTDQFEVESVVKNIDQLRQNGCDTVTLILPNGEDRGFVEKLGKQVELNIIETDHPVTTLKSLLE